MRAAVAILLGLAVLGAYYPGLSGGFVLDDFHNIVENEALQQKDWNFRNLVAASTSSSAGPLNRPVAMFTFAVDAWAHNLQPGPMKVVNLALHVIAGFLVFALAKVIFSLLPLRQKPANTFWPAVLTAAIWLLHPIQTSAVLYVVQRMAVLSALFACLSVYGYIRARLTSARRASAAWFLVHLTALGLAAFSKENGLLALPLILVIEYALLRPSTQVPGATPWLRSYAVLCIGVCLAAAVYLALAWNEFTGGYATRTFTFAERVLTEPRVLWHYVALMLAPIPHNFSLYQDGFALSSGLFQPPATIIALVSLTLALASSLFYTVRGPSVLALGVLWFLIGHTLESTVFPLEIAFEHRNYFPSIGLALGAAWVIACGGEALLGTASRVLISLLITTVIGASTFVVATYWSNPLEHALISVKHNPDSGRAHYAAGTIYAELVHENAQVGGPAALQRYVQGAKLAEFHFKRATELTPNSLAPLISQIELFGNVPESKELFRGLASRLADEPLQPAAGEEMYRFVECIRMGKCPISYERLLVALESGTENRKAPSHVRASLHLLAASVLARELNNPARAAAHVESARHLLPNSSSIQDHVRAFYRQTGAVPPKMQ